MYGFSLQKLDKLRAESSVQAKEWWEEYRGYVKCERENTRRCVERFCTNKISNLKFSKENEHFLKSCEKAQVNPTPRQASKFRNKKGIAYAAFGKPQ